MPKEARVTRTITVTRATALCIDLEEENAKPYKEVYILSGIYNDERLFMKRLQKILEHKKDKRIIAVTDLKVEKNLYGMTEQKFIEEAVILPPRT